MASHLSLSTHGVCYMVYKNIGEDIQFVSNFGFDEIEAIMSLPDIGEINVELIDMEKSVGERGEDFYKRYTKDDFNDVKNIIAFKQIIGELSICKDDTDWFYIHKSEVKGNKFEIYTDDSYFRIVFDKAIYSEFDKIGIMQMIVKNLAFNEEVAENIVNTLKLNQGKFLVIDYKGKILEIWDNFDWKRFDKIKPEDYDFGR